MSLPAFAVTYDYLCPFARNVHEHLACALRDGADWEVEFVPFSLVQAHGEDGEAPAWDTADLASRLAAMEASLVVRDRFPERFLDVHVALFRARHDEARDLRDEAVLRDVLNTHGTDADAVFAAIADGWPRQALRRGHESAVADHHVFGVPTFMLDAGAAFVRIMTRPDADAAAARSTIENVVELIVGRRELNEFKHTSIAR